MQVENIRLIFIKTQYIKQNQCVAWFKQVTFRAWRDQKPSEEVLQEKEKEIWRNKLYRHTFPKVKFI